MLNRLKRELLDRGPEFCLPTRLTDEWLTILLSSADEILSDDPDAAAGALCTGAIVRLLEAKGFALKDLCDVPAAEMRRYFVCYRNELALELVHRNTNVKYEAATVDTVLTERDVVTWQQ